MAQPDPPASPNATPSLPAGSPFTPAEPDDDLDAIIDEQRARVVRKERRNRLLSTGLLLALAGSGWLWFSSDADRLSAAKEAAGGIRSIKEVGSLLDGYKEAMGRLGTRQDKVEKATLDLHEGSTAH